MLSRTVCCADVVDMNWIDQWFSTGEEFLPRLEFYAFRGGISALYLSCLFVVSVVLLF